MIPSQQPIAGDATVNSRDYAHTFFCLSEIAFFGGPMEIPKARQNVDNVTGEAFLGQGRRRQ
jgi:hypothetical protein